VEQPPPPLHLWVASYGPVFDVPWKIVHTYWDVNRCR
jgi:hypothetical protein